MKNILLDLKKLSQNLIYNFDGETINFKVNKIIIDNGDVLNRHRWIYRYSEEYMLEYNLQNEEEIPTNIKEEIKKKAYITSKEQGFEWFQRNIEYFNLLFENGFSLEKDFNLTNGITEFYKGSDNCPPMEYICYEYWLRHSKYKGVEKALSEIRNFYNSPIDISIEHEAHYFLNRLSKRNIYQKFPSLFIKYSKNYLFDEIIKHILIQTDLNNNLEFYYNNKMYYNNIFKTKKIQKNKEIMDIVLNNLNIINKNSTIIIKNKV